MTDFIKIGRMLEKIMAQIDDLNAAIAKLQTDVNTLLAKEPVPTDLTAPIAAVNAIDAQVEAAANPPATPA